MLEYSEKALQAILYESLSLPAEMANAICRSSFRPYPGAKWEHACIGFGLPYDLTINDAIQVSQRHLDKLTALIATKIKEGDVLIKLDYEFPGIIVTRSDKIVVYLDCTIAIGTQEDVHRDALAPAGTA